MNMYAIMELSSSLDFYLTCLYKNLMPGLFKKGMYAFDDGISLCTAVSNYESKFKRNNKIGTGIPHRFYGHRPANVVGGEQGVL